VVAVKLHYRGYLVDDLAGRVLGPDRWGGFVVVESASYNPVRSETVAELRPLPPAEMRHVARDPFGQLVLAVVEGTPA
jgi:hypothetical protein